MKDGSAPDLNTLIVLRVRLKIYILDACASTLFDKPKLALILKCTAKSQLLGFSCAKKMWKGM